jgi:hypothetical protein
MKEYYRSDKDVEQMLDTYLPLKLKANNPFYDDDIKYQVNTHLENPNVSEANKKRLEAIDRKLIEQQLTRKNIVFDYQNKRYARLEGEFYIAK